MYRRVVNKSRKRHLFRTAEECPKTRERDTKDTILAAESHRQMLMSMDTEEPACDFLCHHPQMAPTSCAARSAARSPVNRCPHVLA